MNIGELSYDHVLERMLRAEARVAELESYCEDRVNTMKQFETECRKAKIEDDNGLVTVHMRKTEVV